MVPTQGSSLPLLAGRNPVAHLLRVERDGNPLRRFGHVSPHIGKVAPLNANALGDIAGLAAAALPPGPALVIGMAESALLVAWFLAARLGPDAELRFTTRERRGKDRNGLSRTFFEPHSHGPVHSLILPPNGSYYPQVVIVEDEITTGATLRNLLLAVRDVSDRHNVITLADLRPAASREQLQEEMASLGVDLSVIDLSRTPDAGSLERPYSRPAPRHNPFDRPEGILEGAVGALRRQWRALRPGALYVIGECVDVALSFWETLPPKVRPLFRHVTRSPWLADGRILKSRLDLCNPRVPRYFLYNWTRPLPARALLIGESSTAPIAARLSGFLASEGVKVETVEIPPS